MYKRQVGVLSHLVRRAADADHGHDGLVVVDREVHALLGAREAVIRLHLDGSPGGRGLPPDLVEAADAGLVLSLIHI